jgi:hypothetical protein
MLKAPGTKRLKLQCDDPLSNFAFKFNLRRYITACFAYFSGSTTGMGGDAIHSMGLNEWRGPGPA